MTFEIVPALVAGLAATLVMTALTKMAGATGMTRMPPMPIVIGSMMTGDPDRARRIGTLLHLGIMGTVIFGLLYAALFASFGSASLLTGVAIGGVHGLVFGAIGMPMIPALHPRMEQRAGAAPLEVSGGTVQLTTPGFFGVNWGGMTPMGLVVSHIVYGIVAALVYGALA